MITIPYTLYFQLRQRLYGNTYIFPYIVTSSTAINQASNASEWGNGDGGGNIIQNIKTAANEAVQFLGGFAVGMLGSQAKIANLFPAPTWNGAGDYKAQFSFDLVLINDHIIKARNNYMCVNTIINNNRWLQKTIMSFPGALYEVWLPTGQRHLMCTGDFNLFPLGLNRKAPSGFFSGGKVPGANFSIGTNTDGLPMYHKHKDDIEVIPDAYRLQIKFTSCISNNLNNSVFQYYVEDMGGYEDYVQYNAGGTTSKVATLDLGGQKVADRGQAVVAQTVAQAAQENKPNGNPMSAQDATRMFQRAVMELAEDTTQRDVPAQRGDDGQNVIETFNESTYNKKLQKL